MIRRGQTAHPMQGVTIKKNRKNGFVVFELHYSADPAKRDPKYIETIRQAMPIRQFKQEYELVWDSFEGLPVFGDWDASVHAIKKRVIPHVGLPLLMGFDWGLTPAAVIAQLQEETIFIMREYTAVNMGAKRFLSMIVPQIKAEYPMWGDLSKDFICFLDPSGFFRKDTDETSCASVLEEFGFRNLIAGPVQWEERRNAVEHWLTRRTKAGPCFQLCEAECPVLYRGFQGGYRYPDGVLEKEPTLKLRPIKDAHSHPHDALQMILSKIGSSRPIRQVVSIPKPAYAFEAGISR